MHKASRTLLALGAVFTFGLGTAGTAMAATETATVTKNGESKALYMLTSSDTNDILKKAGVTINNGDLVLRSASPEGNIKVDVRTAYPVTVAADGNYSIVTAHYGDTARQVLAQAGIKLGTVDTVNVPLDQVMSKNTRINVNRNHIVTVEADGVKSQVILPVSASAKESVHKAGVALNTNDEVRTDSDKKTVSVSRVTYKETSTTEEIPYETVVKEDSSLLAGHTEVQSSGRNGTRKIVYRTKYIDGKKDKTEKVSASVVKEAVSRIVVKGTKVKETEQPAAEKSSSSQSTAKKTATASSSSKKTTASGLSYSRMLTGMCTAYTGGGTTATGLPAAVGRVAVNPNVIPYGTRLYITSADGSYVYGYAVAADTGGFVNTSSTMVDLYMNSESECENFGRRSMNIYILN